MNIIVVPPKLRLLEGVERAICARITHLINP